MTAEIARITQLIQVSALLFCLKIKTWANEIATSSMYLCVEKLSNFKSAG
jgi:hypothetical protein